MKVHYKNLGDGLGEVVNEQRAYDTLLSILKRIDIDRKTHVIQQTEIGLIIDGETVPVLVLGDQDPLTIDPTQPNEAQLLHHGAKEPLRVDTNFNAIDNAANPDGLITLGDGLYTTDSQGQAKGYAEERASGGVGVVTTLIPFRARMLDLRGNASVPEPLFQAWVDYWIIYFKEHETTYLAQATHNLLDLARYDDMKKYTDMLLDIRNNPTAENRLIRYALGTRNIEEYEITQSFGSEQNTVFTAFMKSIGFDGLIAWEGVEGNGQRVTERADTFVFYNYGVIGTKEDWIERAQGGAQKNEQSELERSNFGESTQEISHNKPNNILGCNRHGIGEKEYIIG